MYCVDFFELVRVDNEEFLLLSDWNDQQAQDVGGFGFINTEKSLSMLDITASCSIPHRNRSRLSVEGMNILLHWILLLVRFF